MRAASCEHGSSQHPRVRLCSTMRSRRLEGGGSDAASGGEIRRRGGFLYPHARERDDQCGVLLSVIPGPVSVSVLSDLPPPSRSVCTSFFFLYIAAAAQSGSLLLNKFLAIVELFPMCSARTLSAREPMRISCRSCDNGFLQTGSCCWFGRMMNADTLTRDGAIALGA